MKKIRHYMFFVMGMCVLLAMSACTSETQRLEQRKAHAEEQAKEVGALLETVEDAEQLIDRINAITQADDDIFFYIFYENEMVYWSSNRLVMNDTVMDNYPYGAWIPVTYGNAKALARRTTIGYVNWLSILTVIPTEYTEPENTPGIEDIAEETFSFREVLNTPHTHSNFTTNPYYYIIIALFVLIGLVGVYGLIRHRGIRNMRLSTRIMYIILACVLAVFIYLFVMSVQYVHSNFEERQRRGMRTRSEYIQAFMKSNYSLFFGYLKEENAEALEAELRDLGHSIQQDVHVYSLFGELLASSSPALFDGNVLYRRMSPEALYQLIRQEESSVPEEKNRPVVCYEYIGSHSYLVTYLPLRNEYSEALAYISVPYFMSEQKRNAEVDALLAKLLIPYIIVLILALLFSVWAARSMTKPILLLTDKMKRFEIGGKDNHIDYPYHDELGALVERYNLLVDKVEESAAQLARAEREGAWRTMARQIAHEINNPLTPMKLSVQKLQRLRGTENFDAYFEKATPMLISEIDNLAHIAQSFSAFAKQPEVTTDEVDIAAKLSQVITLQRANDEQIPIRYIGADSGVKVLADPEQVPQVFVNILRNAIQASPTDIIVVLNTAYSDKEVQITISDDGGGIPEEIQAKIFQPNFTTKSNGNGLGLAISKHIVEGTGGRITFESSPRGTTFFIYFRKR